MQNVLIVSEVQSYLLVSLQEKLEESECIVTNIHANPDVLSKIKDDVDMIFIFADEELTREDLQNLKRWRMIFPSLSQGTRRRLLRFRRIFRSI